MLATIVAMEQKHDPANAVSKSANKEGSTRETPIDLTSPSPHRSQALKQPTRVDLSNSSLGQTRSHYHQDVEFSRYDSRSDQQLTTEDSSMEQLDPSGWTLQHWGRRAKTIACAECGKRLFKGQGTRDRVISHVQDLLNSNGLYSPSCNEQDPE